MDRSTQRQWIVKILFQLDFNDFDDIDLEKILENHELQNEQFIKESIISIHNNIENIDKIISDKLTNWTIDRLPKIDKAILRTSVNEFVIQETVPTNVSISEAVEIAKIYAEESSYKFINGVLSAISKDM